MPIISPYYHEERRAGLLRNTNPLRYYAEYPGHKLHIDQNEKLQEYGVCHVIAGKNYLFFRFALILGIIELLQALKKFVGFRYGRLKASIVLIILESL